MFFESIISSDKLYSSAELYVFAIQIQLHKSTRICDGKDEFLL